MLKADYNLITICSYHGYSAAGFTILNYNEKNNSCYISLFYHDYLMLLNTNIEQINNIKM